MSKKPKMFVALSYTPEDFKVNKIIISVLESFFSIHPANLLSSEPPQEKVPRLIDEAEMFAAILTKRFKIEGEDEWLTSAWMLNEIGMASKSRKPLLIFKEKGVRLEGITNYVTTPSEFNRKRIYDSLKEFIVSAKKEATALSKEKVQKIDGWEDTKKVIREIVETAQNYLCGVVEDFSAIDEFKPIFSKLNKNLEVSLICSPSGEDTAKLEERIAHLRFKKKELRFVDPPKIGQIRILFNEEVGLLVIHGRGDDYFGIKITPIDDLRNHFVSLKRESFLEKESAMLEGRYCKAKPADITSLIWAINCTKEFEEKDRFVYILAQKFSLFVTEEELRNCLVNAVREGKCKLKIVLSRSALDKDGHPKSTYEYINETLGGNAEIRILKEDYPIGRRRLIVTNKMAMDIIDFDRDGYYYSVIQDPNQIEKLKMDIEKLPT